MSERHACSRTKCGSNRENVRVKYTHTHRETQRLRLGRKKENGYNGENINRKKESWFDASVKSDGERRKEERTRRRMGETSKQTLNFFL